jgi:hypothetical protein
VIAAEQLKKSIKQRYSRKHIQIFKTIFEKGKYRPTYSDQEPATKTLIRREIVKWNSDFTGVVFTEEGKKIATAFLESLTLKNY